MPESPKELEQSRRDSNQSAELSNHQCAHFASTASIPQHWRATLACRKCKSALTVYLTNEFLKLVPTFMHAREQEFITNVQESAYSINMQSELVMRPTYLSNVDEIV